jgi:hypothetical protein
VSPAGSISRVLSEPGSSLFVSLLSGMRDGIAPTRRDNLLSALTSYIRRATDTGEICHFATLLNSGDPTTLLPGTRHASAESVFAHECSQARFRDAAIETFSEVIELIFELTHDVDSSNPLPLATVVTPMPRLARSAIVGAPIHAGAVRGISPNR